MNINKGTYRFFIINEQTTSFKIMEKNFAESSDSYDDPISCNRLRNNISTINQIYLQFM